MTRDPSWYRYDAPSRQLVLTLHVQPGAKQSDVTGLHGGALKVRIASPAIGNAANLELLRFLREWLGLPQAAIALRLGATSRRKVVEIAGGPELLRQVERLVGS